MIANRMHLPIYPGSTLGASPCSPSTLILSVRPHFLTTNTKYANSLLTTNSVLSRVQAFLPQIQSSNQVLNQRMQQDPTSVNIEHISEDMDQYIQMVGFLTRT